MIDLENFGYKCFNTQEDPIITTTEYQKRMDIIPKYKDFPKCNTNNKIIINIVHAIAHINGENFESYSMSIVQDSNDIWCNLKFYSLNEKDILKYGLDEFEDRLIELWKHNYFLQYQI